MGRWWRSRYKARTKAELRPDEKPKVNVYGIEELVADKGYHSGAVVSESSPIECAATRPICSATAIPASLKRPIQRRPCRPYIPEKRQKGQRSW